MANLIYNILFVCDFPFANAGGVGRATETLAKEFMLRGFGVTYLSFSEGQACVSGGVNQLFAPGGNIIVSGENAAYLERLLSELKIDIVINQGGIKPEIIRLFAMIDRVNISLLSVHHNSVRALQENYQHIIADNYRGTRYFQLLSHPVIGGILKLYNRLKYGRFFRNGLRHSDRLVLLSERFIPELSVYLKHNSFKERAVGIPNPAPFEVVADVESLKEKRIVFVGRLNYQQKRVDLLIDLWKRIYDDFSDWSFDIIGEGPDRVDLEKRASNKGLKRLFFHGYQDPRPFLEKAKFFCMTSAYEGHAMVLAEAQAYGVVPFAFDCSSVLSDIVQSGINGYLMPKFDLDSYAQKLRALMADDDRRKAMALAGQQSVLKYQPRAIGDQWVRLFKIVQSERQAGKIK